MEPEVSCKYFVKRKKRFCKMTVKLGKEYCGEHELHSETFDDTTSNRIECPLDRGHTIYAHNLKKHLQVCNARPQESPELYIRKDINRDDSLYDFPEIPNFTLSNLKSETELKDIQDTIAIVNEIYKTIDPPEEMILSHEALEEELKNPIYGPATLKHLKQTASLIGIANKFGLLKSSTSFVEYGAGKGQLSFFLSKACEKLKDTMLVIIDRAGLRHKRDNKIENRDEVLRIRADIADLVLSELPMENNKLVGFGKHLCGAATDLTLRCIKNGNENAKKTTEGFVIALCCHHRCDWRDFAGKDFLIQHGIDKYKFCLITKMASWSICGTGMSRERRQIPVEIIENKDHGLSRAEKEEIGWKCKRILDQARKKYVDGMGYDCKFIRYVPADITVENLCLLGVKEKK